ncbi:hypothetical protein LWI29_018876 [Acer saccharum]|uniref:Uncharacterized protein n=1 Tax=Acer saccharum TaxID=4024 RepID=A0AA39T885_ACESA|nr:hypothetical protein LWI29_018876 [Acer saccharum]
MIASNDGDFEILNACIRNNLIAKNNHHKSNNLKYKILSRDSRLSLSCTSNSQVSSLPSHWISDFLFSPIAKVIMI